jgi:hypothetical protein
LSKANHFLIINSTLHLIKQLLIIIFATTATATNYYYFAKVAIIIVIIIKAISIYSLIAITSFSLATK